jgi:biopolymer transport protein TolQ
MEPAATVVQAAQLAGSVHHDLSAWGLFLQADLIVKSVMIMLGLASIWSWGIIIDKWITFKNINSKSTKFETAFWSGEALEKLYKKIYTNPTDPMGRIFCAGMNEWKLTVESGPARFDGDLRAGLQQRIDRAMGTAIGREIAQLEKQMTFLATVGSTATFIGLFGTVWGIMNSFAAIAGSQNTSLAVVAPGIAEALFATAIGLVAAIPAVVAYNKFSTDLMRYQDRLDAFSAEFSAILGRHLEQQQGGAAR